MSLTRLLTPPHLHVTIRLPCNPWLNTDDDSDFSGGSVFGDWLPSPNQPRVSLDARASNLHSPREIISLYHFPLLRRFRPSRAHLRHPQQLLLPLSNHSDRPERYHAWYTTIKGSVPEDLWRYLDPEGNASSRSQNRSRPRPFGKEHNPTIS